MRNFILLAVTLHLAITVKDINSFNSPYKFGDILSFPRQCLCLQKTLYKHYAIYVDKTTISGQLENQVIFHYKKIGLKFQCVFGTMKDGGDRPAVDNYLDNSTDVGTEKEIINRIEERKENCGQYNLLRNNCEHLATYIRYGIQCSEQHETLAEQFAQKRCQRGLKSCPSVDTKLIKVLEELDENAKLEEKCMTCELEKSSG